MQKQLIANEEKVWGLYPGLLSEEEIESLDEYSVWYLINHYTEKCYSMTFNSKENLKTSMELVKEISYTLDFLIYYTRNFGVEFDQLLNSEDHIVRNNSYKKWYKSWQHHFATMPKHVYDSFLKDKEAGNDLTRYMKY